MVIGFFVLSFVLSVVMLIGFKKLNNVDNERKKPIKLLFVMAVFTILWNAAGVLSGSEIFTTFAHGMYLACTDWLLIILTKFTKDFLEYKKDTRKLMSIMIFLGILDTCSLLVNTFTEHVFSCEIVMFNGQECFQMVPNYTCYVFHLVYVYGMAFFIVLAFTIKIITTVKAYRGKYNAILVGFLIILVANVSYRFVNCPIDFSSIFYSVLAIVTCYFGLFYEPRGLVIRLLGLALRDLYNGIVCYDKDGRCLYCNEEAVRFLRYDKPDVEEKKGLESQLEYYLKGRNASDVPDNVFQYMQKNDEGLLYIETRFVKLIDDKGNYLGCCFCTDDRTDDENRLKDEHYKATHDSLTKIYNREGFFDRVKLEITEHPDEEWCMMCTDIKDFKLVNELFGTKRGDEILINTASAIEALAKEPTVFGRLSADRFAIFIPREKVNEKEFERLISEIEDMATNDVYRMHMHLGIYKVSDLTMEVAVMCDRALLAIGKIKDEYEQAIAYYDEEMGSTLHEDNKMLGEFESAISEEQFKIFLQPQVSVDRKLLGAEALVRWIHPERGMIPPLKFIPLFERSGQIYRLDCYVWEQACRQLKAWKEQGINDVHISVNISPKDFYYIDIYETFTGLVKKYGIEPKNLKLEITETALMTDLQQQLGLLQRLREYGFFIEVDDFGSGYSSLNTLKDIDVDVLKIDMGFLGETEHKEKSRTILNAIIAMSKKLGLTIVTEGVETERQVMYLTDAGCDIFQGYYFDKPLPVKDFEAKYF